MTETILYQRQDHVGRLVLNNPQRHNALGREQLQAIASVLTAVAADPQVRVLIVTGSGDKTFCAGAALQELSAGQMADDAFQHMTGQLAALAIPTVCAINGDVYGGGVELAISCDFRIGVQGSRMRVPAAAIGLCYPLSGIRRFVACLGVRLTQRLLVAAEEWDANTALTLGVLDHLVPRHDLPAFALQYAQQIAQLAPLAVSGMNSVLRQAASGTIDAATAQLAVQACLQSEDLQEGFAAKRAKRAPRFHGR